MDRRGLTWLMVIAWMVVTALGAAASFFEMPIFKKELRGITYIGNFAYIIMCLGGFGSGIVSGAITGFGQLFILRSAMPALRRNASWLVATVIGMTLAWAIGGVVTLIVVFAIDFPPREAMESTGSLPMLNDLVIRGAVVGACVGVLSSICQWFVLRRWLGNGNTYLWVVVSTLAWTAAGILFHLVYVTLGGPLISPNDYPQTVSWAEYYAAKEPAVLMSKVVSGLVVGVVTGLTIKMLLSRVQQKVEEQPG